MLCYTICMFFSDSPFLRVFLLGLLLQIPLGSSPPWTAHICVWAVFIPSVALNCLALTLLFLSPGPGAGAGGSRPTAAQRLLLAALFSLRLLTGLCGAGLGLAEDLQGATDLPGGLQAPCWGGWRWRGGGGAWGELVFLLSSQGCVVLLMTAVALEHRNLRASPGETASTRSATRLIGSSVLVVVVLCCSAALVLMASVRVVRDQSGGLVEGSVRTGQTLRWEPDAGARVALNCGGYLLLTAVHGLVFRGRRRDRNATTQQPRPALVVHTSVTCMLLANAVLSVAEALLWLAEGAASSVLQPAGGSPSLLLSALPAVLDPLLYALLHPRGGEQRVARPGDGKH